MRVVIIGNGIAGITAARHIRKNSEAEIYVISGESRYFFSRTALMYVYMGHMKFEHTQPYENWFWRKNKINLIEAWVDFIDTDKQIVTLKNGDVVTYDKLILATGSKPRKLNVPGLDLPGVQALYTKQDLELMEENSRHCQRAVVVGGGLIGVEMAEMLHSRDIDVTMIVREESFWNVILPAEESLMVTNHIRSRGVDVLLESTITAIEGTEKAAQVRLSSGEVRPADFVGLTIGVQPNIGFLDNTSIETNEGVLVDNFLQTSIKNIYAIGDCAELREPAPGRRAVEPVWYTGRMMGETIAAIITGKPSAYDPGLWFNSAKFFDLEYQTYGNVPNTEQDGIKHHIFQNTQTEKALRIVTNEADQVIGVNALGLRLKQEVCEAWIKNGSNVNQVFAEIDEANFNPEFYGSLNDIINGPLIS